jgi:hypothetical protein
MINNSKLIVEKLLEYFYIADYTRLSQDDDSACPEMSALQLHARVFVLKINMMSKACATYLQRNIPLDSKITLMSLSFCTLSQMSII